MVINHSKAEDNELKALDKVKNLHMKFWHKVPLEEIVFEGYNSTGLIREWYSPYPLKNGINLVNPTMVKPEDIDIEKLIGEPLKNTKLVSGDFIHPIGGVTLYPTAWMEAIIGCPIYASALSCVAKPVEVDIRFASEKFSVEYALKSDWLKLMVEIQQRINNISKGKFPVAGLQLRGIIDMLAAFLGEEKLCYALHDNPESLKKLALKFAQLYIAVSNIILKTIKPFHGGYLVFKLFTTGPGMGYQNDAFGLFSLKQYEGNFLKYDEMVFKELNEFPYSSIHLHSTSLHLTEALAKIRELRVIQINPETELGNTDFDKFLRCLKVYQDNDKYLFLSGLSDEEIIEAKANLKPQGIIIVK